MDTYKWIVIEKSRFAKRDNDKCAFIEFDDKVARIYIKKNQTKLDKIRFIVHEVWEWGSRAILGGAIPKRQTDKKIDTFCNTMDAITIKLIKPYL